MTGFLSSLKADLLDRRLLPLVVVVMVGLVAAIGYVVLGGGSSESSSSRSPSTALATASPGITVSELHSEKAVAETTGGVSQQQHAKYARNPFTPLPQPAEKEKKTATTAAASESSPSSSESSPKESSSSSSESTSSSKPATPPPPPTKPVYHVALLFGIMPQPETPEGEQQLTPYVNVKLLAPLPSPTQALIVYRGVTAGGKTATFTLVSEAILHGSAKCLPSESQCQAIELKPGQSETLEYPASTGQSLVYKLVLVSITVSKGSSANVESAAHNESKAGRELLAHEGLTDIPGLRYSARQGVLVLVGHPPFGKSAHARRRHRR